MRSKPNFRRTLKTGHVPAQGLDIALKNASPLQKPKVLQLLWEDSDSAKKTKGVPIQVPLSYFRLRTSLL